MYMIEKNKNGQAISPETFSPDAPAPGNGAGGTPGTGCACGNGTVRESLAMVYSPRQYWRDAYSPAEALDRGTLFMELDKPLTGVCTGGDAS